MPRLPITPATSEFCARHFSVSERTLSNWAASGFIQRFKIAGQRGLCYDLDEIEREIQTNPKMRPATKSMGTVVEINAPIVVKDVPHRAVPVKP